MMTNDKIVEGERVMFRDGSARGEVTWVGPAGHTVAVLWDGQSRPRREVATNVVREVVA